MADAIDFLTLPKFAVAVTRIHVAENEMSLMNARMGEAFGTVMTAN